MSTFLKISTLSISLAIICSGCANKKPSSLDSNSAEFIDALFIQKSSEAVDAQQKYTVLISDTYAQKSKKQSQFSTEEIDITGFIGKPNTLIKSIAERYGYDYAEAGLSNANRMPTITADIKKHTAEQALKVISYQIDKVATLIIDKDNKVVRLIFKN